MSYSDTDVDDSFMLRQLIELTEALRIKRVPVQNGFSSMHTKLMTNTDVKRLSEQVICELARRRAMGESYSALAADLNKRGICTLRGSRFYSTTILDLLKNR